MSKARLRPIVEGTTLAILYYAFALIVFSLLPFSTPQDWWMDLWSSRKVGVISWFHTRNLLGSMVAAVPLVPLLLWRFRDERLFASLLIAAPTAFLTLLGKPCCSLSFQGWSTVMWLNESVRFFALLLAIPILAAVGGRVFPTHERLRRE
jgi:hypothetical protein